LGHPCKFQRILRLGSVGARHTSSGRQPYFVGLNRGRHLFGRAAITLGAGTHSSSSLFLLGFSLSNLSGRRLNVYHERHGFCPHLYADDMQIYGSCRPQAIHDLQLRLFACIDDVRLHSWMKSNRLQFDTNKTELLWFASARRQHQLPRSACRIGTDDIIPSTIVRDLGIYSDTDLSMRSHVLLLAVLPSCDSCAVSDDQFHRLYSRLCCRPCAAKTGLR